jgi:hypothetical protein
MSLDELESPVTEVSKKTRHGVGGVHADHKHGGKHDHRPGAVR